MVESLDEERHDMNRLKEVQDLINTRRRRNINPISA